MNQTIWLLIDAFDPRLGNTKKEKEGINTKLNWITNKNNEGKVNPINEEYKVSVLLLSHYLTEIWNITAVIILTILAFS